MSYNLILSMRNKTEWTTVLVCLDIKKRIESDKKHFQKTIGGGRWSLNDTIKEYIKILDGLKK